MKGLLSIEAAFVPSKSNMRDVYATSVADVGKESTENADFAEVQSIVAVEDVKSFKADLLGHQQYAKALKFWTGIYGSRWSIGIGRD